MVAVHLEQKMVDFSLVESARKPRRVGKTAKQKAKKVFKELPPKASKKRKSEVKIKMFRRNRLENGRNNK